LDSQPTPFPDLGVPQETTKEAIVDPVGDPIEDAILPVQEIAPPPEPQGPWLESPPWTGFDLLLLSLVLFFGIVFFTAISVGILHATKAKPITEIAGNPSVWIAVPAMGAAYVVMFLILYLLANNRRLNLWQSLSWNWPQGFLWMGFVLVGFALAFIAGLLQQVLPMPKELPIEKMFLQPGAPQLLALFGVLVAPFVEEALFRGLLYPVSNRWLRDVLNDKQRLRRGRLVFLLLIPWGFASQWHSPLVSTLLAVTVLLLTGALYALTLDTSRAHASRIILPGLTLFAWGLVASHLSRLSLERASLVLLLVVLAMTLAALKLDQPGPTATRIAIALSFAVTAISFTGLHSEQLAGSWAPLLVLLLVSSVLTFTRAYTKSLASSFLIHTGYNATLFGAAYLATDHFRHLQHLPK
jgi:membrane protease YdiL (CAAX protease family)